VIAAGGTAGPVVPALAGAVALRDRGAEVHFVGGGRAEATLVPEAGFPFHPLRVEGLDRKNPLKAARSLALAAAAGRRSRKLLKDIDADLVIGAGGYVAGPVGTAARMLGIPLALLEADSHMGLTNRRLAPVAARVFLAFPIEDRVGDKYVVTGRPVPATLASIDRTAARRRFGLASDRPVLLVYGGSLGARTINKATLEAFGDSAPCQILHICGRRDHDSIERRLKALGPPPHYHLYPYLDDFHNALAAADLAVTRAGGGVFELAAAGVPSILVPYPYATADHQAGNARWMAEGGAAVIVADAQLDGPRLAREVGELLSSPGRLKQMSDAATRLARPEAAERIADDVLALAA
jgi:UDP-N-acetylglucosamine--N-acetylmuramyl-(pentapeptide) pyrophosphoryl-undecaprenol N-acetylglucosamine transferase